MKFTWKSSNSKIVSVTKNGKIKGLKDGKTATITVSNKNYKSAKLKVTVGTEVSSLYMVRPIIVTVAGGKTAINPKIMPDKASNKTLSYKSADKKIADVDNNGIIYGIKEGTTKITAVSTDGTNKKTTVTVKVADNLGEVLASDDFFENINADLINNAGIDSDWSIFDDIDNDMYNKYMNILNEVSEKTNQDDSSEDNVSDLYLTAKDTMARDKNKADGLSKYFDEINKVSNINEYLKLAGRFSKAGIDGIFTTEVQPYVEDVKKAKVYFGGAAVIVPKTMLENKDIEDLSEDYHTLVKKLFLLSGESEETAEAHTTAVINLQNDLNIETEAEYPEGVETAIQDTIKEYTKEQLKGVFTNGDITAYLEEAGYGKEDSYLIMYPKHLEKVNSYLKEENLDTLKAYAKLILLYRYAPYLTTNIYDDYIQVYSTVTGKDKMTLNEFIKETVGSLMIWDMSKLYADRYVPAGTKEDVTKMVDEIIGQYYKSIGNCTWMSDETKANAMKKLDKMQKNVCYPDDWKPYVLNCNLKAPEEGGTLVENIEMIYQEQDERERAQLENGALKADVWAESPLVVNAWYIPNNNSITIPYGILSGAAYDVNASKAANYGGIGAVIGHEIGHAFDPTGSEFDENGDERNWWKKSDRENYKKIQQKMIDYYNSFEVAVVEVEDPEGKNAAQTLAAFQNGEFTLGENIADLSGVSCVVKLVGEDKEARKEFFESYAHLWANTSSPFVKLILAYLDPHSAAKVRVNAIVSMIDEFYETYDIEETSAMYVAPEKRIKLWY